MVRLVVASAGKETGALLKEMLIARGVYDRKADNLVCYGIHTSEDEAERILNGNAGRGKIRAMTKMREAGVRTVPCFFAAELSAMDNTQLEALKFPIFARMSHGYGAKDIGLILQAEEIKWRIAAGWEWFSTFIPVARELRVWIFRGEHLDTYEKVMERPHEYKGLGRNFEQGFEFKPAILNIDAIDQAKLAIKAVGLDFAAVDVLVGKDGHSYVLEANTAPGVIRSGCQSTLAKLADKIVAWDLEA